MSKNHAPVVSDTMEPTSNTMANRITRQNKVKKITFWRRLKKFQALLVVLLVAGLGAYLVHISLGSSQYVFQADFDTYHPLNVGSYQCGNESAHTLLDSDIWCETHVDIVDQGSPRGKVAHLQVASGQTQHQGLLINIVPPALDGWIHMLVRFPKAPPGGTASPVSLLAFRWSSSTLMGNQSENIIRLNSGMRLLVIGNQSPGFNVPLDTWVSLRVHVPYGTNVPITLIATDMNGSVLSGASGSMTGTLTTVGSFGYPGRIKFGQGGEIYDPGYAGWEYFLDNLYVSSDANDPGPWLGGIAGSPAPTPSPSPSPSPSPTPTSSSNQPTPNATSASSATGNQSNTTQSVTGMVSLAPAQGSANDPVTKVEYYIDNKLVYTATGSPFTYQLDTKHQQNGTHQVTVKTYFKSGKVDTKTSTIRVANGRSWLRVGVISASIIMVIAGFSIYWFKSRLQSKLL